MDSVLYSSRWSRLELGARVPCIPWLHSEVFRQQLWCQALGHLGEQGGPGSALKESLVPREMAGTTDHSSTVSPYWSVRKLPAGLGG